MLLSLDGDESWGPGSCLVLPIQEQLYRTCESTYLRRKTGRGDEDSFSFCVIISISALEYRSLAVSFIILSHTLYQDVRTQS